MRRELLVFCRILFLAKTCLCGVLLFNLMLPRLGYLSVFDTVYANCVIAFISLIYYSAWLLFWAACQRVKPRARRFTYAPRDADGNYLTMHGVTSVEIVRGSPRLTIENVWVYVYGVGFILFVSSYCMLGLDQLCLACFGLGASVLAIDELVCPGSVMGKLYASGRSASLLSGLVGLLFVSAELLGVQIMGLFSTLDLYSLCFGVLLPILSHFLLILVRDSRNYTLGSVTEVCEFGLPFMIFLGVFHLCVAYGQRQQFATQWPLFDLNSLENRTWMQASLSTHVQTDGPFLVFFALSPLICWAAIIVFLTCALEGSSVDSLLGITLSLCVRYLVQSPTSVVGVYGMVCCVIGIGLRVLCEFSPVFPNDYGGRNQGGQLGQSVAWVRGQAGRDRVAQKPDEVLEETAVG
jgi:hypothetical protein